MRNSLIIMLVLAANVFSGNAQSPVAYYTFNNNQYYDISGNNNHAYIVHTVNHTSDKDGNANNAIALGGGYLDMGFSEDFDFTGGAMTIALWVKLNEDISVWMALANKWDGSTGGYYFGVNPANQRVRFNGFSNNLEDPVALPINEWVHYAASNDGTTLTLYRNGVLVNATASDEAITGNTNPFRIGNQSDFVGTSFNGALDEVLVFDETLSLEQIENIYNNGLPQFINDVHLAEITTEKISTASGDINITGRIYNVGVDPVSSIQLNWSDGINTYQQDITGLDIAPNGVYDFVHSQNLTINQGEAKAAEVWVELVNGEPDGNPSNNTVNTSIASYLFIPEKKIFIEQATGSSFGFSPRGIVTFQEMEQTYPETFIGSSIHFGDLMEVAEYSTNAQLNFFNDNVVNRTYFNIDASPDNLKILHDQLMEIPPVAALSEDLNYNPVSRLVFGTVTAEFAFPTTDELRFGFVITEDSLIGTDDLYNQANEYAGGQNGPMGGFENLPNPIPFDQIAYPHVGRALIDDYSGVPNSLPASIGMGETHDYTLAYEVPENFNENRINIITLLLNTNDGTILNAVTTKLTSIISGNNNLIANNDFVKVFPNPFTGELKINLDIEHSENTSARIINTMGQEVTFKDFGIQPAQTTLSLNTKSLNTGIYYLYLKIGEKLVVKKSD